MTAAGFYRVFSYGTSRIGAGWREVYAEVGPTTVKALDWTTGDTAKFDAREWRRCGAAPSDPRKLVVRRCLKRVLLVREKTKIIRSALRATRRKTTV